MAGIKAHKAPWSNNIELLIYERTGQGRMAIAKPPLMEVIDEAVYLEPTMSIGVTEAQELMDGLWQCGLRPSEGSGSAGSLAATERHLADMQKIAFKVLDKTLEDKTS